MEEDGFIGMISPIKLGEIPDYGIVHDVEAKHLTVKAFPLQDDKQDDEVQEIQSRFVQLNRMDGSVEIDPGQFMGIFIMAFSIGMAVGPLLSGVIADYVSIKSVFYFGAMIGFIGTGLFIWFTRQNQTGGA